jgi:hypothetical protein
MNQRAEYPLYYAPGHKAAIENQGVWNDRWIAQVSGKIQSLPSSNYWPVSLACDDGCAVEITDNNWLRRMGRWQDQPAMHLGSTFVRNNDSVNIRWYENRGEAAIWLKQGQQALTLPPLAMECDMSVSLADGAPVTNNETVSLALDAPDAVEMRVGFHENLSDVSWQPFSASSEWTLAPANDVMEQTIYAQFRDQEGALLCDGTVVADSIVVDRLPPEGQATLERTDTFTYIFQLDAHDQDSGSGVKDVAILPEALAYLITEDDGANATIWQSYSNEITLPILMTSETQGQTTYQVWFRDAAGNISEPITIEGDSPDENKADGRLYLPLITR